MIDRCDAERGRHRTRGRPRRWPSSGRRPCRPTAPWSWSASGPSVLRFDRTAGGLCADRVPRPARPGPAARRRCCRRRVRRRFDGRLRRRAGPRRSHRVHRLPRRPCQRRRHGRRSSRPRRTNPACPATVRSWHTPRSPPTRPRRPITIRENEQAPVALGSGARPMISRDGNHVVHETADSRPGHVMDRRRTRRVRRDRHAGPAPARSRRRPPVPPSTAIGRTVASDSIVAPGSMPTPTSCSTRSRPTPGSTPPPTGSARRHRRRARHDRDLHQRRAGQPRRGVGRRRRNLHRRSPNRARRSFGPVSTCTIEIGFTVEFLEEAFGTVSLVPLLGVVDPVPFTTEVRASGEAPPVDTPTSTATTTPRSTTGGTTGGSTTGGPGGTTTGGTRTTSTTGGTRTTSTTGGRPRPHHDHGRSGCRGIQPDLVRFRSDDHRGRASNGSGRDRQHHTDRCDRSWGSDSTPPTPTAFEIVETGCAGEAVPADGRCSVTIAFAPTATGEQSAQVDRLARQWHRDLRHARRRRCCATDAHGVPGGRQDGPGRDPPWRRVPDGVDRRARRGAGDPATWLVDDTGGFAIPVLVMPHTRSGPADSVGCRPDRPVRRRHGDDARDGDDEPSAAGRPRRHRPEHQPLTVEIDLRVPGADSRRQASSTKPMIVAAASHDSVPGPGVWHVTRSEIVLRLSTRNGATRWKSRSRKFAIS